MPKQKKQTKKSEFITKNMTIGEIIEKYPEAVKILIKYDFHCIGCHVAASETLEQGAEAHGVDIKKLLKEMNKAIEHHK